MLNSMTRTGTFARTGAYAETNSRWDAATLLLDGRVLLTGGAAELFDPQSGTFSLTGQMQMHETVITATLLKNGTVLFLESEGDYPAEGVEIYDPATGTFSHIASLYNQGDSFSAAVRRDDGTVLIAGGQLPGGNGIPVAQLYLPATGTFASAGTTEDPHWSGLITLLKHLQGVLVAGRIDCKSLPFQLVPLGETCGTRVRPPGLPS